ncbi:bestrophin family protein [Neolewinella persica]|uniref:bestrophin family protein n=1 Tax=Neolewinella persica TaxID=70998 RepID=UPI00036393D3|nr:bestrophin family ion channel [Neolewinella persica]
MFINKNFTLRQIWQFTGKHIPWIVTWMTLVAFLYEYADLKWLSLPWLPLSVIGTAVAFYVGFKNNSAYDRMWEARKIWGAIINSSRAWGATVKSFVSNQFTAEETSAAELDSIVKTLLYRHIGWLYALRSQLLVPTPWEHISQGGHIGKVAERYREVFGVGLIKDEVTEEELRQFLLPNEFNRLINYKNTATQIIDQQSQDLKALRQRGIIEDFRHMELQKLLNDFYVHQGKCERIKKFPLPRQYANMSFIFVGIFIFLLPFGMVSEFAKLGEYGSLLSIPFSVLVAWVYVMMELVGDYSENPFEGLGNDIPMLSLCRVIEIDLREMLGETNLPPSIEPVNGVLM